MLELSSVAVEKPWGGTRLKSFFPQKDLPSDRLGELWLVSTVGGERCHSKVTGGDFSGLTLRECLLRNPEEILGQNLAQQLPAGDFPLLFKWIDACEDLSVQVHPDDSLAQKLGLGENGKEESWLILDAEPGAAVRAGFSSGWDMTRLVEAVTAGADISESLQRYPVQKGDLLHIPPGTVHSIGGGVLLAEIQQPSDVTFRIYDGETLGLDGQPRELHLDMAVKTSATGSLHYCEEKELPRNVWHQRVNPVAYQITELHGEWNGPVPLPSEECSIFTCLSGEASLDTGIVGGQEVLRAGDVRLILPGTTSLSLKTVGEGWFAVFSPRSGLVDP